MTTATSTFEPIDIGNWIPETTYTGPVDGVWTITAPDSVTQEVLDSTIVSIQQNLIISQNMQALFDRIAAGLPVNRDFLAIASPTVEDNAAQIQALTRQINALLILRTGDFYDISGT